jgi:biopolymer transport protein ExbD
MKLSALAALLIANALPSAAAAPTVEVFAGETEMKVAVPARVDDVKRAKDEIIILVKADGGIVVAGKILTSDELLELLKKKSKQNKNQAVRVRGDAAVGYQRIVEVIEICQKAALWNVSFGTERKAASKPADTESK